MLDDFLPSRKAGLFPKGNRQHKQKPPQTVDGIIVSAATNRGQAAELQGGGGAAHIIQPGAQPTPVLPPVAHASALATPVALRPAPAADLPASVTTTPGIDAATELPSVAAGSASNEAHDPSLTTHSQGWKTMQKAFLQWHWTHGKRASALLAVVCVVLIGGASAAAVITQPEASTYTVKSKGKAKPKAAVVPLVSNLTGLPISDAAINDRPVTGVMIENSPDARPQSGLDQAGVVFEAIAEGGITRFLALFQDTQPDYIGPVRSVRPYYLQWCMGFDCALAHVGGSPEALQDIRNWGAKDLDQFAAAGSYWRISSRYAPHNMYTSTAKLTELESSRGYGRSSYTGFVRKAEQPHAKQPGDSRSAASSINLAISAALYNARFDYDAASNSYKRSQGGAPHLTVNGSGGQTQIQPKVVVAIVTTYGVASDKHSQYGSVGSGEAYVFQDGTVTKARWAKTDGKEPLTLTGPDGKPLALNPGQTWITALAATNQLTYQ